MNMCPPLAVIAGPTASGKSALALALAERIGGWVVNADSAQVYRDLHILSARPSAADEARARHLVYGYRDGAEACSAADWATDAKTAIADAHAVGATPILVGGTGLYIRTLLDGIAPVPPIDPAVRAEVRALSTPDAYALLTREDADAATRLGPSDTTRIARALEVVRSTGKALAHWQAERSDGIAGRVSLHPLLLLPPRDWLYHRCNRRFETMIETGCEEVQRLLSRGLSPDLPVMRAIGVPEMAALARGKIDAAEARERGAAATRRYAKRQYTWFRHQPPAEWPRFEAPLEGDHLGEALALLERSIAGAGRID